MRSAPVLAALSLPLSPLPLVGVAVAVTAVVVARRAGARRSLRVALLGCLLSVGFSAAFVGCRPSPPPAEDLRPWEAFDRLFEG